MIDSKGVIDSEVKFLVDNDLAFDDATSTVIALRSSTLKLLNAYTTSGIEHAGHQLRMVGAYATHHFNVTNQKIRVTPRVGLSPGQYLLEIHRLVTKCEDAVHRSNKGDLLGYMVEIIRLCRGFIDLLNVPERP